VLLRPVAEADYPVIYSWRVDANFVALWHTPNRRIPTYREYVPELEHWLSEGITLLVADGKTGRVSGFGRAYNVNLADGWAWLQAYLSPEARLRPFQVAEAAALFANYLFGMFPLRKLYSEVNSYNEKALRLNERLGFREHGRLPEHTWYKDRYWDLVLFSLSREDWSEQAKRVRFLLAVEEEAEALLERQSVDSARSGG
jgi:RimJ/RimL family protein N-acetyltransferase